MKLRVYLLFLCLHLCCEIDTSHSASIREKRDLKTDLIANAQLLRTRADNVIAELEQQNRTHDTLLIEIYADIAQSLANQLNASTNETEINELKTILTNTEGLLLLAIESEGKVAYDFEELRLSLIIYGEQVIERAVQQTTSSDFLIKNYVNRVNESVSELKNVSLMVDVYTQQIIFMQRVTQLEEYLFQIGLGLDVYKVEFTYQEKAYHLLVRMVAVINRLINDTHLDERLKNDTIAELEREIDVIANKLAQLINASDKQTLAELEINLTELEIFVQSKLAIMGIETVSEQEKQTLLREIKELYERVLDAMSKLSEQHTPTQAMFDEYLHVRDLYLSVRNIVSPVSPLEFFYFESRFREIQRKVNDELNKFGV